MSSTCTITASSSTYPRFQIISNRTYTEYRYYSHDPRRTDAIQKLGVSELIAAAVALFSYFWFLPGLDRHIVQAISFFASVAFIYFQCTAIIYESVVVFPPHGVQFEVHRGPFQRTIFTSRKFYPMVYIEDVLINEGLRCWNVRYYLALLVKTSDSRKSLELAVLFKNTLPHFPVLLQTYRGLKKNIYGKESS